MRQLRKLDTGWSGRQLLRKLQAFYVIWGYRRFMWVEAGENYKAKGGENSEFERNTLYKESKSLVHSVRLSKCGGMFRSQHCTAWRASSCLVPWLLSHYILYYKFYNIQFDAPLGTAEDELRSSVQMRLKLSIMQFERLQFLCSAIVRLTELHYRYSSIALRRDSSMRSISWENCSQQLQSQFSVTVQSPMFDIRCLIRGFMCINNRRNAQVVVTKEIV